MNVKMKKVNILLLIFLSLIACKSTQSISKASLENQKPKVIILTDINNAKGDPDDKQSLIHLLWYADELDILGIIPDRWNGKGYQATMEGFAAYEKDYPIYLKTKGYPKPAALKDKVAQNETKAIELIYNAIKNNQAPIYILVWGQMRTIQKALFQYPEIASEIRLLTIGTGRKYGPKDEVPGEDCNVPNWNGPGRNAIYQDERFNEMWWLENNWTYNGMFVGNRPEEMLNSLSQYGAMGQHIKHVVQAHSWAQYFRVGDTPTVLYLIDPTNDLNDPTKGSWAGQFKKPFLQKRPNYFTDDNGPVEWDYQNPCNTWHHLQEMYAYNKQTLSSRREGMYQALLKKLEGIYNINK